MVIEIKTFDQAKLLAQTWMQDRGFFSKEILPCPEGLDFILEGKDPNGIPFLIIHPKQLKSAVVVIATVKITDSSFASLSALKSNERDDFLWNLKKELIFAPPMIAFDPTFEETGIPKGIQFSKEIYYDELTEGRLAETVDYATRSALWVVWTFRRKFGAPKESAEVKSVE
jgi:hypothetical protein